jgi:hypothetical protein
MTELDASAGGLVPDIASQIRLSRLDRPSPYLITSYCRRLCSWLGLGTHSRASIVALLQRVARLADPLRIDGWRAVAPCVTDEGRDGGDLVVGERPAE